MDKQKFIDQLSKLVSFQTVSGNVSENSKALTYVESLLNKKAVVKRIKNGDAEILIAQSLNSEKIDIVYMVHMDVVAANPQQFSLNVDGDKLYGRGVSDMKFSIPIGIELLDFTISEKPKTNFALIITTDEETGGFLGGKYVADVLKIKPKCFIVPDGGDNLTFVNKAKGVCQLVIKSKGSPAHASRPWMGKNALDNIVKLANKLIDEYGKNSIKENWGTTMNIGQIEGGISINQVCPEATMKVDFRYPESDSIEAITSKVTKLAKEVDTNFEISQASTGLPTFTDVKNKIVINFLKFMESAYNQNIIVTHTYGASDARHFAKYNIPVLMMKPMGGEIHSETEWVSISSSLTFFEGLKGFLNDFDSEKDYA